MADEAEIGRVLQSLCADTRAANEVPDVSVGERVCEEVFRLRELVANDGILPGVYSEIIAACRNAAEMIRRKFGDLEMASLLDGYADSLHRHDTAVFHPRPAHSSPGGGDSTSSM